LGTNTTTNAVWSETIAWRVKKMYGLSKFAAWEEENWRTRPNDVADWQNAKLGTATAFLGIKIVRCMSNKGAAAAAACLGSGTLRLFLKWLHCNTTRFLMEFL